MLLSELLPTLNPMDYIIVRYEIGNIVSVLGKGYIDTDLKISEPEGYVVKQISICDETTLMVTVTPIDEFLLPF